MLLFGYILHSGVNTIEEVGSLLKHKFQEDKGVKEKAKNKRGKLIEKIILSIFFSEYRESNWQIFNSKYWKRTIF